MTAGLSGVRSAGVCRGRVVVVALLLLALFSLAGCHGGRLAKAEAALEASPLVASFYWDSGDLKVRMVKGKGWPEADRIYCELLLPYGIDHAGVYDSKYRFQPMPASCPQQTPRALPSA